MKLTTKENKAILKEIPLSEKYRLLKDKACRDLDFDKAAEYRDLEESHAM